MTTITREQQKQILIDTANHVISRDNTSPYSENLRELARIALASLEAEPIGAFHIADQQVGGTSDYIKDGEWPIDNGIIEVYAASPAQEAGVYKDMLNIVDLLENNEWAEHCTSTVLGSLLESEITRLVGKEQPVPVVPDEWITELCGEEFDDLSAGQGYRMGWNACRATMLNGDTFRENSISSTNNFREMAETSTNSPVIPDGWISCSERMPEDEQEVIVHNKLGYRYVSYFDEHSGLFFDMRGGNQMNCIEHILITHWMPLPAPPQK
ncbi:DUF551 domain-containing protein [Salmonella enterica]|nr:DUF551 domain-containing protein [Salmonella enterica]EHO0905982.1 DUF551 domain-containing protein [Salmonella enterica]